MKDLDTIKQKLQLTIGDRLLRHSVNVMDTAVDLAKHYGVDIEKARIAGVLHDCGKLKNKNIGNLEHSKLGCEIATTEYGVNDEEILDAIKYHTTGRENMTMLEKIVYIADKIEPDRNYDGVESIRELAYKNIDDSIIKSLNNTFNYLKQKGIEVDKSSEETLNYLLSRRKND